MHTTLYHKTPFLAAGDYGKKAVVELECRTPKLPEGRHVVLPDAGEAMEVWFVRITDGRSEIQVRQKMKPPLSYMDTKIHCETLIFIEQRDIHCDVYNLHSTFIQYYKESTRTVFLRGIGWSAKHQSIRSMPSHVMWIGNSLGDVRLLLLGNPLPPSMMMLIMMVVLPHPVP